MEIDPAFKVSEIAKRKGHKIFVDFFVKEINYKD